MKKLYYGGKIITMEKEPCADALLTDGGTIAAVGRAEELEAMGPDERENLGGCALLPGFIDAHSHFSQVAAAEQQVSLAGAGDISRRIRDFIAERPPERGEWVTARDFDPAPGAALPSLAELDAVSPGSPLLILYRSGHMALMNSAALAACGITPSTPDPDGGRIGRDEGGRLTGYLEENAFFACRKSIPLPGKKQLLESYAAAQRSYAGHGITTVQEGMFTSEMLPMYALLADSGIMKLDLVAYAEPDAWEAARRSVAGEHIRLGGMKIFLDGSPQGRTAWMTEPYAGESSYRGYGSMSDEAVESAMLLCGRERAQLLAHCNGDAAADQFLRCLSRAEEKCPALRALRPVIIHAQLIRPDQLVRAGELGAVVSFFAAHVWHWGDTHVRNFGPERARRISPAASALALGLPFTFHQDSPVIDPDMLETVWCAAERRTRSGAVLGGGERISVPDALRAVTINAAYQYFEEDRKGSLRAGKAADMTVLSADPLSVPPDRLRDVRVLETIKDGETVFRT